MISRISVISKSPTIGQTLKSINFQNPGVRYHHVISAGDLHRQMQLNQMKICPNSRPTSIEQRLCFVPGIVQHRNFSLTSLRTAAPAVAAVAASDATAQVTTTPVEIPSIPDAPVSDGTLELLNQIAANGEPTLASLGLGGTWTPIAWLQNGLEFLHVSFDLPWWGAIAVSTVIIRLCMTPLVVLTQKNAAIMHNTLPEMQELQLKVNEARSCGNALEYAQANQELMIFMKEKNCNPIKNMLVPMVQAPIFMSYFIGLRRMANAPVESMQTGGLYWFTDLTVADPYYILPLITCSTLALTLHLGTDMGKTSPMGGNSNIIEYVLKGIPIIVFPFIMNFPAALAVYWASSNFCSLIQGLIFRIPKVRAYFNIPQKLEIPKPAQPKKGFVKNIKGAWSNMKLSREIEDRRRLDQIQFERAGTAPIVRTYKFDPTKIKKSA